VSSRLIDRVATIKRSVALAVRERLPDRFRRVVGNVWNPSDAQPEPSLDSAAVAQTDESAKRDSFEHKESEAPDPGEAISSPGPNADPTERSQERRRKRRKILPEPAVPVFIKVGPGRYIRREEPTPSSDATETATAREGGEENLSRETQDSAASPSFAAEELPLDEDLCPGPLSDAPDLVGPADAPA
jgi:hypothetical protein